MGITYEEEAGKRGTDLVFEDFKFNYNLDRILNSEIPIKNNKIKKENIELKVIAISSEYENKLKIITIDKETKEEHETVFLFNLSRNRPGACCGIKELGNFSAMRYPDRIGYELLTKEMIIEGIKTLFNKIINNSRAGERKLFMYFTIVVNGTSGTYQEGNTLLLEAIKGDERYVLQESFINKNSGNKNDLYIIKN